MGYLLDEVLQGTNSAERQVAVRTIVGHLLGNASDWRGHHPRSRARARSRVHPQRRQLPSAGDAGAARRGRVDDLRLSAAARPRRGRQRAGAAPDARTSLGGVGFSSGDGGPQPPSRQPFMRAAMRRALAGQPAARGLHCAATAAPDDVAPSGRRPPQGRRTAARDQGGALGWHRQSGDDRPSAAPSGRRPAQGCRQPRSGGARAALPVGDDRPNAAPERPAARPGPPNSREGSRRRAVAAEGGHRQINTAGRCRARARRAFRHRATPRTGSRPDRVRSTPRDCRWPFCPTEAKGMLTGVHSGDPEK